MLEAILNGELTNEEAAAQLELSSRQLRRLLAAYRVGGVDALRHANVGRVPAHAVSDDVRAQILQLVRTRYAELNPTELAQRLAVEHGIRLHRTTVRRILLFALGAPQGAGPKDEPPRGWMLRAPRDGTEVHGNAQQH